MLLLGSWIYYQAIPNAMKAHMGVAVTTQEYVSWYRSTLNTIFGAVGLVALIAVAAVVFKKLPKPVMVMPFVFLIALMGMFERSREFIRKPFAIGGYLYANGIRKEDYPLLQKEGLLAHAPYVSIREITPENSIAAGKELFTLTCTRCHTVTGVNSVVDRFKVMYGNEKWEEKKISNYIAVMHQARTFMPPFPGTEKERLALAAYISSLQNSREKLEGVQSAGIKVYSDEKSRDQASINTAEKSEEVQK